MRSCLRPVSATWPSSCLTYFKYSGNAYWMSNWLQGHYGTGLGIHLLILHVWTLVIIRPQIRWPLWHLIFIWELRTVFQAVISFLSFTSLQLYFCEWCKQCTKWSCVQCFVFHWPTYLFWWCVYTFQHPWMLSIFWQVSFNEYHEYLFSFFIHHCLFQINLQFPFKKWIHFILWITECLRMC